MPHSSRTPRATVSKRSVTSPAEAPPEELFETFDASGRALGLVARSSVHARGLWHRAANVLLRLPDGRIWVQRRAPAKDLYAGYLDFTVGEHLKPGETYAAGAQRGLQEELSIGGVALEPFGPIKHSRFDDDAAGIHDHELQQAYLGLYDGPMTLEPAEVAEVRAVSGAELQAWIATENARLTPWFRADLERLGYLPRGSGAAER